MLYLKPQATSAAAASNLEVGMRFDPSHKTATETCHVGMPRLHIVDSPVATAGIFDRHAHFHHNSDKI